MFLSLRFAVVSVWHFKQYTPLCLPNLASPSSSIPHVHRDGCCYDHQLIKRIRWKRSCNLILNTMHVLQFSLSNFEQLGKIPIFPFLKLFFLFPHCTEKEGKKGGRERGRKEKNSPPSVTPQWTQGTCWVRILGYLLFHGYHMQCRYFFKQSRRSFLLKG